MSDQVNRLAGLAGVNEGGKAPKYVLPILKFNGKTGAMSIVHLESDKSEEKIETMDVVILRKRMALELVTDSESYWSNEYNSTTQKIHLFKKDSNGKIKLVGIKSPGEFKEENPELKTKNVLYVLYKGGIYKLEVKGSSLSSFFAYQDVLKEEGVHSFQVSTNVSATLTKHPTKGFKYAVMAFKKNDEEVDLDAVETGLNAINTELAKVDAYFAEKAAVDFRKNLNPSAPVEKSAAEKLYDSLDEDQANINIDDIPF